MEKEFNFRTHFKLNVKVTKKYGNKKLKSLEPRPVFFNLGSAEPKGSAKIFLGSAKFLDVSFIIH
jgi:hypothetical protein